MFFSGDIFSFSSFIPLFWEILTCSGAHRVRGGFKRRLVQPPGVYDEVAEAWPGEGLWEAFPGRVSSFPGRTGLWLTHTCPEAFHLCTCPQSPSHTGLILTFLLVGAEPTTFQCSLPLAPFAVFPTSVFKSEALRPVG